MCETTAIVTAVTRYQYLPTEPFVVWALRTAQTWGSFHYKKVKRNNEIIIQCNIMWWVSIGLNWKQFQFTINNFSTCIKGLYIVNTRPTWFLSLKPSLPLLLPTEMFLLGSVYEENMPSLSSSIRSLLLTSCLYTPYSISLCCWLDIFNVSVRVSDLDEMIM